LGEQADYLADLRGSAHSSGLIRAVRTHDTPALFKWFVSMAIFQGISDAVAAGYMEKHGRASWHDIQSALAVGPSCPKLANYWQFCVSAWGPDADRRHKYLI